MEGGAGATLERLRRVGTPSRPSLRSRLAPDFNAFDYLDVGEAKLSEVLASLLDPNATHALGAAFLKGFLAAVDALSLDPIGCEHALVQTEVPTDRIDRDRRRIGILATWDRRALAVENKPCASDQEEQLADYLRHLDRAFPDRY